MGEEGNQPKITKKFARTPAEKEKISRKCNIAENRRSYYERLGIAIKRTISAKSFKSAKVSNATLAEEESPENSESQDSQRVVKCCLNRIIECLFLLKYLDAWTS
jgi:hypothetical protein